MFTWFLNGVWPYVFVNNIIYIIWFKEFKCKCIYFEELYKSWVVSLPDSFPRGKSKTDRVSHRYVRWQHNCIKEPKY